MNIDTAGKARGTGDVGPNHNIIVGVTAARGELVDVVEKLRMRSGYNVVDELPVHDGMVGFVPCIKMECTANDSEGARDAFDSLYKFLVTDSGFTKYTTCWGGVRFDLEVETDRSEKVKRSS